MAESFRMAVSVLGNVSAVCLYAAPIGTFRRVIRKKSTEEFSCVPYIVSLLNSLLYTWYGMPVVSNKWENFPLVTVNGIGIVLELSYVLIYFWYASRKRKVSVAMTAIPVLVVFCIIAITSAFAFHDHHRRRLLVGSIGLVVSITMYGSPLIVMKKVIKTKSVEFLPLPLSLCSLINCVLWLIYGLLNGDIFVMGPNAVGAPLAIVQLILHCKYWKRKVAKEPNRGNNLEKDSLDRVNAETGNTETANLELGNTNTNVTEQSNNNLDGSV